MANMLRPTTGPGLAVYWVDAGVETGKYSVFPHILCAGVAGLTPQWPGVDRGSHRGGVEESWSPASPTFRNT